MLAWVVVPLLCGAVGSLQRGSAALARPARQVRLAARLARMSAGAGGGVTETIDFTAGAVRPQQAVTEEMMRPRPDISFADLSAQLAASFSPSPSVSATVSKPELLAAYEMMLLCRQFENACNQAYMQGLIRGFMHLDNGQETIPAMLADCVKQGDIKVSYYREHTHALASGVSGEAIMAELFARVDGTCKGAGGSMHIYDKATHFQGGWALVAEQLPYAVGGARSILLDRHLGIAPKDDDRIAVVFCGEGGSQNGRMAECLNAAAKENLPILFIIIDNGRAINTFTPDVAANSEVWQQGQHYGVPGIKVDGGNVLDTMRVGRSVVSHVRTKGPAILQIHTYRLTGHSPADPEHERGRKAEKKWARAEADPIKLFEGEGHLTAAEMEAAQAKIKARVNEIVEFAKASPPPPRELAKTLEFPDPPDTDYNARAVPTADAAAITARTLQPAQRALLDARLAALGAKAADGSMSIGDAVNLAVLEEMLRDPMTVIHAEDLQAGSSYDIPALTQQTFGSLRAADEIIDEGHFIGKALGEGLNGYRPIVELMNSNFGIYGMAELSSAGNTFATTGGAFKMPMTIIGAGGTAPNQSLGAEHSQPFHAYVMGIPGLKICTAASPAAAYGLTKAMIRDDGPGILFCPVKMMKEAKGKVDVGRCLPLNKAELLHKASEASVAAGKAVTVLTYLHGVKEAQSVIEQIMAEGVDIDLIELRSLKPLDMATIGASLRRTHKLAILDESTFSGGVGATVSAAISEALFYELDKPVLRLCMDDAPVPYAASMEAAVVKRGADLVDGVLALAFE